MFFYPKEKHTASAVAVVVVGVACFLSWGSLYIKLGVPLRTSAAMVFEDRMLLTLSYLAVMMIAVFFFRRLSPLSPSITYPFCALAVIGTFFGGYAHLAPGASGVLNVLGAVFVGLETGWLLLLWSNFFGYIDSRCTGFAFALSFIIMAVLYYAIGSLPRIAYVTCASTLPVISTVAVHVGTRAIANDQAVKGAHRRVERAHSIELLTPWHTSPLFSLMKGAFVTAAVFGLAFSTLNMALDRTSLEVAGFGALGVIMLVAIMFFSSKMTIKLLYRASQPLMGLGALCIPFSPHAGIVICSCAYAMILYLLVLAICEAANRFETTVVRLTGFAFGINLLACGVGETAGFLIRLMMPADHMEVVCTAITVALMGYFALASDNGGFIFEFSNSMSKEDEGKPQSDVVNPRNMTTSAIVYHEAINQRCNVLAGQYKLSVREEEIFALIMQGHSIQVISDKLSIMPGTVKTHINHLYKKLGVQSRDEMRALVGLGEAERAPSTEGASKGAVR